MLLKVKPLNGLNDQLEFNELLLSFPTFLFEVAMRFFITELFEKIHFIIEYATLKIFGAKGNLFIRDGRQLHLNRWMSWWTPNR